MVGKHEECSLEDRRWKEVTFTWQLRSRTLFGACGLDLIQEDIDWGRITINPEEEGHSAEHWVLMQWRYNPGATRGPYTKRACIKWKVTHRKAELRRRGGGIEDWVPKKLCEPQSRCTWSQVIPAFCACQVPASSLWFSLSWFWIIFTYHQKSPA